MSLVSAALTVAKKYKIFPAADKAPAISNELMAKITGETKAPGGFHYATRDKGLVEAFWRARPAAHIGVPMQLNGLICLDVDLYKDAEGKAEAWLEQRKEMLIGARIHRTQRGGLHFIMRDRGGLVFPKTVPGYDMIDIKHRGYVLWPPSRGYEVLEDGLSRLPKIPEALAQELARGEERPDRKPPLPSALDPSIAGFMAGLDEVTAAQNERLIDLMNERRNTLSGYETWTQLVAAWAWTFKNTGLEERALDALVRYSLRWEADRADPDGIVAELSKSWDAYGKDPARSSQIKAATAQKILYQQLPLESAPPPSIEIPEQDDDDEVIAPRPWLMDRHIMRGYVSTTVAPGGTGKSSLAMVEAFAMALHQPILGGMTYRPLKVLYWCGEDDLVELKRRRKAIQMYYGLDRYPESLTIVSGRDVPLTFARTDGGNAVLDQGEIDRLRDAIKGGGFDVVILDPFAHTHSVNENSNDQINLVLSGLRTLADQANCGIELIHHTTKEARDKVVGVSGARGASALVDAVRSARYLQPLSKEQAQDWGVEPASRHRYVGIYTGKANMSEDRHTRWFFLANQNLGNGTEDYPHGDDVGVATPWAPPDRGAREQFLRDNALRASAWLTTNEPGAEVMRVDHRSGAWAGFTLAEGLGLDLGSATVGVRPTDTQRAERELMKELLASLAQEGLLELRKVQDAQRRTREAYRVNRAVAARMQAAFTEESEHD